MKFRAPSVRSNRRNVAFLWVMVGIFASLLPRPAASDDAKAKPRVAVENPPAADKAQARPEPEKNDKNAAKPVAKKIENKNAKPVPADVEAAQKKAVDAYTQQFKQQFRPALSSELSFVRQLCDIPIDKRPVVRAAGEASLEEAAKKMAEMQQNQMRGIRAMGEITWPNPDKYVREGLAKSLQENLTPEQFAVYKKESELRSAARKHAAILCVVARIDDALRLSAEQRDKIAESIASGWKDGWESWLMIQQYPEQYLPAIPDQFVAPHLSAQQKPIWQAWQKVNFGYWYQWNGQVVVDDDWWGGAPKKAGKPARPPGAEGPIEAIYRSLLRVKRDR